MICDKNSRLEQYAIPHGELVRAFLDRKDIASLEKGRYDLGEGCYVNITDYNTVQEISMEAHRKFIDVQVMFSGWEKVNYAPIEAGTPTTDYNETKDVQMFSAPPQSTDTVLLKEGFFMAFFPADLHGPNLAPDSHPNRKLVFKIPV